MPADEAKQKEREGGNSRERTVHLYILGNVAEKTGEEF